MTKKQIISFEVKKDTNAEPTKRYILRVLNNGTCFEAPRFTFLDTALSTIDGYVKEFPNQKHFKIEINL